jgi:hypothetical protein
MTLRHTAEGAEKYRCLSVWQSGENLLACIRFEMGMRLRK